MNSASSDSSAGSRSSALRDDASVMSMDVPSVFAPATTTTMPSEDDLLLHNVGMAALAAVAQYPHAVNQESGSLLVSEVVSAMSSGAVSPHHFNAQPQDTPQDFFSDYTGLVHSHPDADAVTEEPGLFSPRPWSGSDVSGPRRGTLQQLIERTALQNTVMIESGSDSEYNDSQGDLIVDYEVAFEDSHASPSTSSDDDLDDFIRFYPGETEYHHQRNEQGLSRHGSMGDINLDDFYDRVNYDAIAETAPQAPGIPPMGPFPVGDDQPELGLHPESIIHTASTILCSLPCLLADTR